MPSDRPFSLSGVKRLLAKEQEGDVFDAFPYGPKINIEDRIKAQATGSYDTVLIDGPYSTRQAQEMYGISIDTRDLLMMWTAVKREAARILKPGGKAICFGWNSNGVGKTRGFKLTRQANIPHGGQHNDTLITVERRVNGSIQF